MPGNEARPYAFLCQHALRGNGNSEDCGLREFGQLELFFRAFEAQLRQRKTKRLVGFFEGLFCSGKFFVKIAAHADGLRALSGKKECHSCFIHAKVIVNRKAPDSFSGNTGPSSASSL